MAIKNIRFLWLYVAIVLSGSALADTPYTTYQQRLAQAEIAITGSILSIHAIKFSNEKFARKVVVVKIDEQRKGKVDSANILVTIGYHWPNKAVSSQDIDIGVGDSGQWLLNRDTTGLFYLNSPDSFIRHDK